VTNINFVMNTTSFQFIDGSSLPVGTMYCIGRNYAAHAREMNASVPDDPIVFIKPPAAYVPDGGTIVIPTISKNVHHEVELVVVIGSDCVNVLPDHARGYIAGYGVGIDVTLRDVQSGAKQRGEPWAVAKGFVTSAPISNIVPVAQISDDTVIDVSLSVNGELRQRGNTSFMERNVAELVSYVARIFTLRKGDCIFTGTPEGVAQIISGDSMVATLNNYVSLHVTVQ
jgi:2-keto-4-pentenoate hydratase/2-oxohepta-3-ene-1,7-dioic acid hydratase in catechol pathway